MRKTAVIFGAGNIGRGFLGQLFWESGYEIVFVDVRDELVEALNARAGYPIRIVDAENHTLTIDGVSAVNARDSQAVSTALARADIAATAVGVPVMGTVAGALAAGLAKRFERTNAPPLDIIICENMLHAGRFMRDKVREHLEPRFLADLDAKTGFVEASIGRMVPVMSDAVKAEDPLLIEVEAYCDLPVDRAGFRGGIPDIAHLQPKDNFGAYVERKLFVHNLGHAATAYLGHRKGCAFIWQAIEDAEIRTAVEGAMEETCLALHRKHGMPLDELREHAADLRRRFSNRALGDQIARVARDPIRKLGPNDRLIGAARLCLEQGVDPVYIGRAIAAAIMYDEPADPEACRLQDIRSQRGPAGVLTEVCGMAEGDAIFAWVRQNS